MRAWRAFIDAHASVVRQLEHELRSERDLPIAWYEALLEIHEQGGSLRMHELADRLLLSRSATTRFADRLERAGLVERRQSSDDRRGTVVTLTKKGFSKLEEAVPVHLRGVAEHFVGRLTADEAEALYGILEKFASVD